MSTTKFTKGAQHAKSTTITPIKQRVQPNAVLEIPKPGQTNNSLNNTLIASLVSKRKHTLTPLITISHNSALAQPSEFSSSSMTNILKTKISLRKKEKTMTIKPNKFQPKSKPLSFSNAPSRKNSINHNELTATSLNILQKQKAPNKTRADLQFLKKNLTKNPWSLSLLDFWSNDMIIAARKLIRRPYNNKFIPISIPEIKKSIFSTKLNDNSPEDFKNYNQCFKQISQACAKVERDSSVLRSKINASVVVERQK